MSAAMRSSSSVNPHLLGALGLTLATAAVLGAILLFGDPDGGRPAVQVSVPPAPEIDVAENTPVAPLRGDQVSLDDPSLDQLAPPPENASDVSLDGLDPIDPDAPVRTRAELAAAQKANSNALPNAPVAGLTEPGPGGPLPVIGPNGQSPADAYKRPFENSGKPAIALVVGGLGMSEQRTRTAIETLPAEITLGFVPYAENLQNWIDLARENGHEVILELPMEPFDYPQNDPGPHTLLTEADSGENIRRLEWLLSRTTGYFGVTNYLGAKFTASESAMRPVWDALADRGLVLVHDGAQSRSPLGRAAEQSNLDWAAADRIVDSPPAPDQIDKQFLQLEALALQNGSALGMGFAYPVTIDQAKAWSEGLEAKGYALVPASAILEMRANSS